MITSILQYELRYRFTQWITLLLYVLLIFQGIWYTKGTFDYYVNEDLLMNAPAIFYKNLAGSGILMIIIVAVITGPVLFKDLQHKTGQWLFTNPIREKKFFTGRFLAAFLINILVAFGYVIGMLLVPYSGIGEAHRFGSAPLGQLLHGFFTLTVPNLLLLTSLVFFTLVYFKKMAAGYLAVLATVVAFLLMQTTAEASGTTPLLLLADPFGYVATDYSIEFMSVSERNYGYLRLSDYLLYNRLLWLGVSLILFVLAYLKFNFKDFLQVGTKVRKKILETEKVIPPLTQATCTSKASLSFLPQDFVRKLFSLSRLEFRTVVRPTGFKVVIGIVVLMNVLQNLLWNASYYIGPTHPLTFTMTAFRLSFGIFIMILLMVWAGELFFKDRTVSFWQIADALPIPMWVVTLSRFISMSGVAFLLAFTFMLTGIVVQLLKGGLALVDLNLYAYDLLGYNWGWLTYVLQIAFVFFVAGLTKNRFATHIISVGVLFLIIIAFELKLAEQTLYAYAAVPGLEDYSEISKYGIWSVAARWYFLMWFTLAVAFILGGIWGWQRGSYQPWFRSFSLTNKQLSGVGKIALIVFIVAFVGIRFFIIAQVNGKGNYTPSSVEETQQADYEKNYTYLQGLSQPRYQTVDLSLDFFPQARKAEYSATIQLANPHQTAIDTLFLNFEDHIRLEKLAVDGKELLSAWQDDVLNIAAWNLPSSLAPDSTVTLTLSATKQYVGFTQSGESPQPDLMFNGSFGSIRQYLPVIGYNEDRELSENRARVDHGLEKLSSRMASVDDEVARREDAFAPDANWVTGTIQVSTDPDQRAIAPGELTKSWEETGRHYFQYTIDQPAPFHWYVGSSQYEAHNTEVGEVDLQVLYDKKHSFNISLYEDATRKALRFIDKNLGKFPYQQIRIAEIPYYQEEFYSFPGTIAISEKEGWYADTTGLPEKAYLYHSVASQLTKQWLYQNMKIANVQGADMLKVALPEALALMFLEENLGKEAKDLIVQKKSDQYAKERNNEPNTEPSLLYADGADYLETNKGAIAFYELIKAIDDMAFFSIFLDATALENSWLTFQDIYQYSKLKIKDPQEVEDIMSMVEN